MPSLQNWPSVIQKVQTANLQQDQLEKQIQRFNKIAYKQELDRQIQLRNYQNSIRSAQKQRELQEAKMFAEAQRRAKQHQKHHSTKIHRQYGSQNESISQIQHNIKSLTRKTDNQNIRNFLQHPFVKLVDNQDARMRNLRQKFIKQNQINLIQQKLKNREKNYDRFQQWQQKNNFIDHVEQTHAKRSEERQKFKNKYLRIKKAQDPTNRFALSPQPVEKTYIKYLDNQIKQNNQHRIEQKQQIIDPRINPFYSSHKLEPDSSPAFLGRNPLSHQRKRQLHYINKHLNTQHQRSYTAVIHKQNQSERDNYKREQNRSSNNYLKLSKIFNPQDMINEKQPIYYPLRSQQNRSENIYLRSYAVSNREKIQTQTQQRKIDLCKEPYNNLFRNDQSQDIGRNKRMKSQQIDQSFKIDSKLPQIHKRLEEPISNTLKVNIPSSLHDRGQISNRPERREFFRYDPITGKQAALIV